MIPLPEKTIIWSRGTNGHVYGYTADQMRAYADAVRADERERAAQICTAAMPNPVMNWCDAQMVDALRKCAEAIRDYPAQDKTV